MLYKESEHHNFLQKCFSRFNFSNRYATCTLIKRCNAPFSVLQLVFLPLSHPLLKQETRTHSKRTLPFLRWIYSAHQFWNTLQKRMWVLLQPRLPGGLSHTFGSPGPGLQVVAWKSGSPRPRVAHLAEPPNNLHILCISLCSWHASSELRGWISRKPAWNFTCFQKEVCQIELFAWTTRMNEQPHHGKFSNWICSVACFIHTVARKCLMFGWAIHTRTGGKEKKMLHIYIYI